MGNPSGAIAGFDKPIDTPTRHTDAADQVLLGAVVVGAERALFGVKPAEILDGIHGVKLGATLRTVRAVPHASQRLCAAQAQRSAEAAVCDDVQIWFKDAINRARRIRVWVLAPP